jgi:hypothetical protein
MLNEVKHLTAQEERRSSGGQPHRRVRPEADRAGLKTRPYSYRIPHSSALAKE